jgi:hypothetical protein
MKNKTWVVSVAVIAVCLLSLGGSTARAQDGGSKFDFSADYSYISHSVTSSFCGGESFAECFDPGLQGAKIAAVWNVSRHVGVECNLAYHAGTHTIFSDSETGSFTDTTRQRDNVTTYLCGPKVTEPVGNFELFTHFLAGGMHVSEGGVTSDSGDGTFTQETAFNGTLFGMEVGGGVDWVHHHWGIRLLEVDYVHGTGTVKGRCTISCGSTGEQVVGIGSANDIQIAMGVNFRFGGMK